MHAHKLPRKHGLNCPVALDRAQAGAAAAAAKAVAMNEKYQVTDKVSKGLIGGLNKVCVCVCVRVCGIRSRRA
jgi:hypothetical protein